MKKQTWIRQELFDEAKRRCAVLEAENAALKARELAATDSQQPQLEMPGEADFMAWCGIQQYNQSDAASIYRYIARHIKRVR